MTTTRSERHVPDDTVPAQDSTGLHITLRTGSGTGSTRLSAFDHALHLAGVADFNLVTLSSVIPPGSRLEHVDTPLAGGHGDLLFCVRAEAYASHPGEVAWAGLGWCADETGAGLFVEHHGSSEEQVRGLIAASLADMVATRGHDYGAVSMSVTSATCVDQPVCALVLAAYQVSTWHEGTPAGATGAVHPVTPDADTSERSDDAGVSVSVPVPVAAQSAVARVSVESRVDTVTAADYYQLYRDAFSGIETRAVARHMLHESEFLEEMHDPRVRKYIAWGHDGQAIGMTTLTTDLEAVPWISPRWFARRFPEHSARNAVYYFGFALVHPEHQGAQVLHAMIEPMALEVMKNRGVVSWDMCAFNDARGFGETYMKLLEAYGEVSTEVIDHQTYYAAIYHDPAADPTS
ncbi:pyruvoyl-dependent arginine decarboxylase [Nocardioides sp. cx-173]|uniref:pyruvoyl-dependent arginine decarboxylase n=1 Tax=Nocardioides sp. cx-173 TaxID=2898796 RepID=UPI001E2928DD|nr:pyruvoyl-dependent arginine decarboxylase [Nocardioides sp. cx-173]MCD4525170.1 pyruvoyl-dependent arginine decarboxylase [Nocardioides sp. cx-173]UGB40133.1 pyruvoyl-dependent arginine decarboxylase [Nocardioides sp. cx-173]